MRGLGGFDWEVTMIAPPMRGGGDRCSLCGSGSRAGIGIYTVTCNGTLLAAFEADYGCAAIFMATMYGLVPVNDHPSLDGGTDGQGTA